MAVLKVPDNFKSIQDAIDQWQPGDVVRVAQGLYPENVKLQPGVILEGGFSPDFSAQNWGQWPSVIDGGQNASVVVGANEAQLNGFTLRNGRAEQGGGIFLDKGRMIIKNNLIEDNVAEFDGGGLYISGHPSLHPSDEKPQKQHPYTDICYNIIRRNEALGHRGGFGGGILVRDSKGGIRITNNVIGGQLGDGNTAKGAGGGIYVESTPIIDIEDNEISQNTAENGHGGGVVIFGGTANSNLSKNKIHHNNLIHGNYGGGVYVVGGTVISRNSIMNNVTMNFQLGRGGGIAVSSLDYLTPTVENNFIYNNSADYGGGIHVDRSGFIDFILIVNNSIAFNKRNSDLHAGGGVHVAADGRCILLNNIIWDNSDDFKEELPGSCVLDHNDIKDGDGFGKLGNISSDPKFVSRDDLHIVETSPAIDAGNPAGAPKEDIDGQRRSRIPDIGADEFT